MSLATFCIDPATQKVRVLKCANLEVIKFTFKMLKPRCVFDDEYTDIYYQIQ